MSALSQRVISLPRKNYDDLSNAMNRITEESRQGQAQGFVLDLRLQPGWLARSGNSAFHAFLDRVKLYPPAAGNPEETDGSISRPGDLVGGQAGDRADQWWLCFGIPEKSLPVAFRITVALTISWHNILRKGSGRDHHPAMRKTRFAAHTALYTPHRAKSDPGEQHQALIPRRGALLAGELRGRVKPSGEATPPVTSKAESEDENAFWPSIAYVPPDPKGRCPAWICADLLRGR